MRERRHAAQCVTVMNTRRRFPFATWTLFTLAAAPLPLRAELFSWGYNVVGELGDATTVQRNEPVAVVANGALAGKTVTAVAAGESFSLALTADGKLFAWGSNGDGQIGDGTGPSAEGKLTPVAVLTDGGLGGKTIVAIAAGSSHSLALTSDGELFAWGGSGNGQRGDGTRGGGSPFPGPVNAYGALAGRRIVAIAAARAHSLALTADGQVFAWGDNDSGQLGDGTETDRTSPAQVIMTGALAGKTVTAIAAGQVHSFALTSDGKLFAWGANGRGNLGDGTTTNRHSPVAVRMDGPLGDKIIASVFTASGGDPGREHSLALTSDGLLLA